MRFAIIETAPFGGLLHYAVQLGDALAERGNDVDLVTARGNELVGLNGAAHLRAVLTPPVAYGATVPPSPLRAQTRRALTAVRVTRAWTRVIYEVARGGYDAVIVNAALQVSPIALANLLLLALPDRPRVAHVVHQPRLFDRPRGEQPFDSAPPSLRRLLGHVYQRSDLVLVHGERSRRDVLAQWPGARVAVIPHGDERLFGGDPPPPASEARILFFGEWHRAKGIPVLLEAFDLLAARHDRVSLTIAGAPNRAVVDVDAIRRWAGSHRGRVRLVDEYVPIEEVPALFAGARVVAAPYLASYQSGVVHLAMTMARAVVASDVGDLSSAVVSGETGLLVPPGDPQALADALERVILDPTLAARLGAAGRRRALSGSGWEQVAATVERAVARLLADDDPASKLDLADGEAEPPHDR